MKRGPKKLPNGFSRNTVDMVGEKFGTLTVIEFAGTSKSGTYALWKCECECGNITVKYGSNLRSGKTKSCGCRQGWLKHGLSGHQLYGVWVSMKQRCFNAKDQSYHCYGGRGISVCDEWIKSFMSFYKWAIKNGYENGLTIDRIDNDGDYTPENCQWLTRAENTAKRYE